MNKRFKKSSFLFLLLVGILSTCVYNYTFFIHHLKKQHELVENVDFKFQNQQTFYSNPVCQNRANDYYLVENTDCFKDNQNEDSHSQNCKKTIPFIKSIHIISDQFQNGAVIQILKYQNYLSYSLAQFIKNRVFLI